MGDYAQAEPLYLEAQRIFESVLGKKHPAYATSLSNLALLHYSMGSYAKAEPRLRQALEIERRFVDESAAVQSERQQLEMARASAWMLHAYVTISLAPEAKVPSADVYRYVLAWKGATFARQTLLMQLRSEPAMKDRFDDYLSVCTRLAARSLATPLPAQRQAWLNDIQQLTEQKEQWEVDFAQRSAAFRQQQLLARLTPAQLQGYLPEDAALVDVLEYWHLTVKKGKLQRERHLIGFVVRSTQEVQLVPLGPAAPIAGAISRWRRIMQNRRFEDRTSARELRALLWDKLEPHLKGTKTVLVSPDGVLSRFSWAALPGQTPATYLIEERAVAVVPVPQLLPQLLAASAAKAPLRESMLLVGDINYAGSAGKAEDLLASRSAASREPTEERWSWNGWSTHARKSWLSRIPSSHGSEAAPRSCARCRRPNRRFAEKPWHIVGCTSSRTAILHRRKSSPRSRRRRTTPTDWVCSAAKASSVGIRACSVAWPSPASTRRRRNALKEKTTAF
jgi:hypothetical protein